jgi:hypothetical protein
MSNNIKAILNLRDKNKHYANINKFGSYKFGFMVRTLIDLGLHCHIMED